MIMSFIRHHLTEKIKKQYLQMVPLKDFDWGDLARLGAVQEQVLNETCSNPVNSKHGPSLSYRRSFLKHLMRHLEQSDSELCDELYEAYGDIVSKSEEENHLCHKSYILPCGKMITLEESPLLISKGTTGLNTWPACLYLCEWVLENKQVFKDRRVVELGSGVGLLGLLVCICCSPRHYIFSDCHEHVLGALWRNLHINRFGSCEASPYEEKVNENFSVSPNSTCTEHFSISTASVSTNTFATNGFIAKSTNTQLCQPLSSLSDIQQEHEQDICTSLPPQSDPDSQESCKQHSNEECRTDHGDNCGNTPFSHNQRFIYETEKDYKGDQPLHSHNVTPDGQGSAEQLCRETKTQKVDTDQPQLPCVSVEELDWETVDGCQLERLSVGIVLATDVVYDVHIIEPLTRILHQLLSSAGDRRGKPTAFIASTIRNWETYQCFLDKLDQYGIRWTEVTRPCNQVFYYDHSCDISLLMLQVQ